MSDSTQEEPAIVVGVPGTWSSMANLATRLSAGPRGWSLVDGQVTDSAGARIPIDVYNRDPGLARAFSFAGKGRLAPADLERIAGHTMTIYLLGFSRGLEATVQLVRAGAALLNAGGIAVKIETTGVAHSASTWLALAESDMSQLVDHFVVYVGSPDRLCSCGMHSFALPDASISPAPEPASQNLLATFNRYQLREQPVIRHQDTFQPSTKAPVYRLDLCPYDLYPVGNPFHNPYGRWHLQELHSN